MNKFLITVAVLLSSFVSMAQTEFATERKNVSESYAKNRCTVATTLGYNKFYTTQLAVSGLKGSYDSAQALENWVDQGLFVGIEGGWFFSDNYKLTLEFGFNHTYNPGYKYVPGVDIKDNDGKVVETLVPTYNSVSSKSNTTYGGVIGVNRYFQFTKSPKLSAYVGAGFGFAHGVSALKEDKVASQGVSYGESYTFSGILNTGLEYLVTSNLYLGIQVSPFMYNYNVTSLKPIPVVAPLKADASDFSFLARPTFKIGFNF